VWTCPKCGEQVVGVLDHCWNCGVDRTGAPLSDSDKNVQLVTGKQRLHIDARQGLFFCAIGGLLGSIFFYFYRPSAPLSIIELIVKAKNASENNIGMHQFIVTLTKAPTCHMLSGLILFGLAGYMVDRIIGNGTSRLCRISHFISCSDIDKPVAQQIIFKGLPQVMVEHRLGFPLQIVTKESTQIYIYKFIKITFENGKVSGFE
jgi:hypothetical protein